MIKVNLLLVKKKKKQKPVPAFLISTVFITLAVCAILAYLIFFFSEGVSAREGKVRENEAKISDLKQKLKDVENYEKLNANFQKRKEIIETLSKNKSLPVKILDETSRLLPAGVWLTSM
jgi:type IV pilus assembly protein PilN